MSNLVSFAELVLKGTEEKKLRLEEDNLRKISEVAPLLSELFSSVSKSKILSDEVVVKEIPLIKELKAVFSKTKKDTKKVLIETETANTPAIKNEVTPTLNKDSDSEKKFLKLFSKLQTDFQNFKKYVETRINNSGGYPSSTSGSGEVRVLRMDDVDTSNLKNGSLMVWDTSSTKFQFVLPSSITTNTNGFDSLTLNTTTSGEISISYSFSSSQVLNSYNRLLINGLKQSSDYYTLNTNGITIMASLNVIAGDVIHFQFSK